MITNDFTNRVIKSYEFRECIGAGGFGAVYRAFQPSVGREVAIKVILPQHADQPDFIRRFEVEAQLIAHLEHPHIVPLYDYWRDPEGAFLVMRWLSGSLGSALKKGSWSSEAAARLLDQMASALTIAHREGVVHRDIKPDNILLDEDENAYLADFGIAKDTNIGSMTEEGTLVGSPAYITPEQIKGEPITPRADIYTLGLVIYETLVGERPFADATTPMELISRHLTIPIPSLNTHRTSLPAALNEVLQTATAKDPTHRYANMQRFASAFRAALPNLQRAPAQPLTEPLTERELDILRLIVDGLSNAEIVDRFVLTLGTVKWYISQIYAKLDVHSCRQAIERARQLGLLEQRTTMPADLPTLMQTPQVNMGRSNPTLIGVSDITNPYKGLRAFQENDAVDFFGRAALTEQLLARLTEEHDGARFLAIAGPSGSGKSSVVRAGLIPALRHGALPNSGHWFITDMLPGTHPFEELEAALLRVSVNPVPGLHDQLAEDRRGLVRAAKRILPSDQDVELVLVIDQFEELFTLVDDEAIRAHFIDNLLSAATDPRSRVRIVLTLRADFYHRPLNYPRLAELMRSHTEIALPMTTSELERAITGPGERIGLRFEAGLVAAMIADVNAQPGALPLLQYALTELFERRADLLLTLHTYRDSGRLTGALARRADELFGELEADGKAAARQIFLRLVTLGEGIEDTRRRVLQAELEAGIGETRAVEEVLVLYGKYRLLTFDRDPLTHSPTVEIAHEALIREWARLRDWSAESRDELRIQRRLSAATSDWQSAERDPSFLAAGARLAQFEALLAGHLALTAGEREYVIASSAEHTRREAQVEVARQRELILAQQAAHSQRRAANRLRYLVGTLAIFLVVAALLSLAATKNASAAAAAEDQAQHAAATARADADQAITASWSLEAYLLAQSNRDTELAHLLEIRALRAGTVANDSAAQAVAQMNIVYHPTRMIESKSGPGQMLNMTLSSDGQYIDAVRVTPDYQATVEVWDVQSGQLVWTFKNVSNPSAPLSPDGKSVLIGKGMPKLVDIRTNDTVQGFITMPFPRVYTLALSPNSQYVAAGDDTPDPDAGYPVAHLWNIQGKEIGRLVRHQNIVYSMTFSPDSQYLLTGGADDTAILWNVQTGNAVQRFVGHTSAVTSVAFSLDGSYMVSSSNDQTVRLWDTQTGKEIRKLIGHSSFVLGVAFSPDGKTILTGSNDRTARLWDVNSGQELLRLGHPDVVRSVTFSPDGKTLITGCDDGNIRLWDLQTIRASNALIPTFAIDNNFQSLADGAFSPDGKQIVLSGSDHMARIWDIQSEQQIRVLTGHSAVPNMAGYDRTGRYIVTATDTSAGGDQHDLTVRLWDAQTGLEIRRFDQPIAPGENPLSPVSPEPLAAVSPDSKRLVVTIPLAEQPNQHGASLGLVRLYDIATGNELKAFGASAPIAVAFSPDGKYILTTSVYGGVSMWDTQTGERVRVFSGHTGWVTTAAFSPDGKYVLALSADKTILMWDAQTGKVVHQFDGVTSGVGLVGFSPDGKLVWGNGPNGALIWDAQSGQLQNVVYGVQAVDMSPDGKSILAFLTQSPNTAQIWPINNNDLIPVLCARLSRDFTDTERILYHIPDHEPTCPQFGTLTTPLPPTWTPVPTRTIPILPTMPPPTSTPAPTETKRGF